MKPNSRILTILSLAASAALVAGCNPPAQTSAERADDSASQQMDRAETDSSEATQRLNNYTYSQKQEFVAEMERELEVMDQRLDELSANMEKLSSAERAEAEPRLLAMRQKSEQMHDHLDNAKGATASTWDNVKASASSAYGELKETFHETRKWLGDKIAS